MYFLLVFQLLSADVGQWTQLGLYETEAQCDLVAQAIRQPTTLKYMCAPSKPEGKKV